MHVDTGLFLHIPSHPSCSKLVFGIVNQPCTASLSERPQQLSMTCVSSQDLSSERISHESKFQGLLESISILSSKFSVNSRCLWGCLLKQIEFLYIVIGIFIALQFYTIIAIYLIISFMWYIHLNAKTIVS